MQRLSWAGNWARAFWFLNRAPSASLKRASPLCHEGTVRLYSFHVIKVSTLTPSISHLSVGAEGQIFVFHIEIVQAKLSKQALQVLPLNLFPSFTSQVLPWIKEAAPNIHRFSLSETFPLMKSQLYNKHMALKGEGKTLQNTKQEWSHSWN